MVANANPGMNGTLVLEKGIRSRVAELANRIIAIVG